MPVPPSVTSDTSVLQSAVRVLAPAMSRIKTSTLLPLERLAVAQRVARPPQSISDPLWETVPPLTGFFNVRLEDELDCRSQAWLAYDDQALYVRFHTPRQPGKLNFSDVFYHADSVELFLDPQHDHFHYFQFALTAGGKCVGLDSSRPLDSERWENKRQAEELPPGSWHGQAVAGDDGWTGSLTIPFTLLGVRPQAGRPWGFNLFYRWCADDFPGWFWNETYAGAHAPWAFGALVLGRRPEVHVPQIDLGEVHLWDNRGQLWVENMSGRAQHLTLHVTVNNGEKDDQPFFAGRINVSLPAHPAAPVAVPFEFPFDPEDYRYHHLHLELKDAHGAPVWQAVYRFGRGVQAWLLQIDDRREGPPAENPDPSDPDFMAKKRRYIVRRLPRFTRRTTAQGAPSDFTLEALDGSVRFDLMRPGVLQNMADYIFSSYDNDVDRLLGATFFIHQTAVMNYANAPTALVHELGPLSVIRFGSAQCCCFAGALLGLLQKLRCAETGRPYRGARIGIPGHVTTVVEYRGKYVHLDPSVGRFYFLRDNRTLASMQDLLADPALAGRAGKHLEAFHRQGAANPDAPSCDHPGRAVWPAGAPAE